MNVPSLDISQFIIDVTYDLSGATPQICLDPASIGAGQASVKYNYKIMAPGNIVIHENTDFGTPDAVGNGDVKCYDLPTFNGTLIWSGSDYIVIATMQDTADLQFSQTIEAGICPPRGNDVPGSWYGQACVSPQVKCDKAKIAFHDSTNYDYKGKPKTLVSKTWTLIFPSDPLTGDTPAPVVVTGFNDVFFDITYNGNYFIMLETVYEYDLGNNVSVKIKYTTYDHLTGMHQPIAVECYLDLCPLICEYKELIKKTRDLCGKNEVEFLKSQRLLVDVTALMTEVNINKSCGKPVGGLIAEIKRISGFTCNCDCGNNGITPRSLIATGGGEWVFGTSVSCGISAEFSQIGNNILLTLSGKTYVLDFTPNAESYGFSFETTDDGCLVTNIIDINLGTLSDKILDLIALTPALVTKFCAIVAMCDAIDPFAGVDLKCVTPGVNNVCDYYGNLPIGHHPTDTFHSLTVNGVEYSPPTTLLYTNDVQINAWLATLPFGFAGTEYVVTGLQAEFTALANINSITQMKFKDSATLTTYGVFVTVSNCVGATVSKMQALIDTVCNIFTDLYGVDSVLYKVRAASGTTPGFLEDVIISPDGSIGISVNGNFLEIISKLKTVANDNCGGALVDKFISNNLFISVVNVDTYASDYVITSTLYGAGQNVLSVTINGTVYPINIVTTNLAGIEAALNALGLGVFVVTHPGNLVITSSGNKYVVTNAIIETVAGPTYTTFNAAVSNTVLLGTCPKLSIEPKARTWTEITLDGTIWDEPNSLCEYASLDSLGNVMMNILAVPLAVSLGTKTLNPADQLPLAVRPRTTQRIEYESGWDGVSDNETNFIIVKDDGYIDVEINFLSGTTQKPSIYYPTN